MREGAAQDSGVGRLASTLVTTRTAIFLQSVVAIVVVWWLLAAGFELEETISSPAIIAMASYELFVSGDWIPHIVATLRRTVYGFVLSMVVGTAVAIVMGVSEFWEEILQDYVTVGLAFPSLFAAVFSAMWFGFSDLTPMMAGFIGAFPFVTQNVYEGFVNIDEGLIEMGRSFGVERRKIIRHVIVPSLLPEWFAGARYGFAICWKLTTLAELIVAGTGVGYMIQTQLAQLSLEGVITWTLYFAVIIMVFEYGVLQQVEKRLFRWRETVTMGI